MRILLLCIIFVIFAKMCPFFPGEVPRGNLDKLYKILKYYTFYSILTCFAHFILVKKKDGLFPGGRRPENFRHGLSAFCVIYTFILLLTILQYSRNFR